MVVTSPTPAPQTPRNGLPSRSAVTPAPLQPGSSPLPSLCSSQFSFFFFFFYKKKMSSSFLQARREGPSGLGLCRGAASPHRKGGPGPLASAAGVGGSVVRSVRRSFVRSGGGGGFSRGPSPGRRAEEGGGPAGGRGRLALLQRRREGGAGTPARRCRRSPGGSEEEEEEVSSLWVG